MKVGEVADLLIRDYGVYNALNLDAGEIVSVLSRTHHGRPLGSKLAVFAPARR